LFHSKRPTLTTLVLADPRQPSFAVEVFVKNGNPFVDLVGLGRRNELISEKTFGTVADYLVQVALKETIEQWTKHGGEKTEMR
jgi:hypothetical protein